MSETSRPFGRGRGGRLSIESGAHVLLPGLGRGIPRLLENEERPEVATQQEEHADVEPSEEEFSSTEREALLQRGLAAMRKIDDKLMHYNETSQYEMSWDERDLDLGHADLGEGRDEHVTIRPTQRMEKRPPTPWNLKSLRPPEVNKDRALGDERRLGDAEDLEGYATSHCFGSRFPRQMEQPSLFQKTRSLATMPFPGWPDHQINEKMNDKISLDGRESRLSKRSSLNERQIADIVRQSVREERVLQCQEQMELERRLQERQDRWIQEQENKERERKHLEEKERLRQEQAELERRLQECQERLIREQEKKERERNFGIGRDQWYKEREVIENEKKLIRDNETLVRELEKERLERRTYMEREQNEKTKAQRLLQDQVNSMNQTIKHLLEQRLVSSPILPVQKREEFGENRMRWKTSELENQLKHVYNSGDNKARSKPPSADVTSPKTNHCEETVLESKQICDNSKTLDDVGTEEELKIKEMIQAISGAMNNSQTCDRVVEAKNTSTVEKSSETANTNPDTTSEEKSKWKTNGLRAKPEKFSGTDSIDSYLSHFETCARANRWKKEKSTDCDSALIPLFCVHG